MFGLNKQPNYLSEIVNRVSTLILVLICKFFCAQQINICFRIDDYGIDDLSLYKKLIPVFNKQNIPLTMGVVPFVKENGHIKSSLTNEKKIFLKSIISQNIEIALHGYLHENKLNGKKEASEFYNQSYLTQFDYIKEGKDAIEELIEKEVDLFIPPWNTYDSNTVRALIQNKFKYISAARYGLIERDTKSLRSIPYTCLLDQLNNAVMQVQDLHDSSEKNIIVLIHAYDFGQENKSKSSFQINEASIYELESMLEELKLKKNINFFKLTELNSIGNDIQNIYFPSYIFPVYSFLKNGEPLSLKELSNSEKLRFKLAPILILLTTILAAFILNMIMKKSIVFIDKFIIYYYIILVLIFSFFLFSDTVSAFYLRILVLFLAILSIKDFLKEAKT